MTNVTKFPLKFRVRQVSTARLCMQFALLLPFSTFDAQPANTAVRLVHGSSTVDPGETCMLEVEVNGNEPGKALEPIEIVCGESHFV
jgi:hypothetical protein